MFVRANLFQLFLILILLNSCKEKTVEIVPKIENPVLQNLIKPNPIDTILGDKLLDFDSLLIRENNFQSFYGVTKENLNSASKLYELEIKGDKLYILNQVKAYTEARLFSAVLALENDAVSNYLIFEDYKIKDAFWDGTYLYVLLGNFENYNTYWKSENKITLLKLSQELDILWTYTAKDDLFNIVPVRVESKSNILSVKVNLSVGCHICYNIYEINLNEKGAFISVKELYKHNSDHELKDEELEEIFGNKMKNQ